MVNRLLTAALRELLLPCCGAEKVDSAIAIVLAAGWRPPLHTLLTVEEVEALADGTPVLVGSLSPDKWPASVGVKVQHGIQFAGEDTPYPLHDPRYDPPLPVTVVWQPQDVSNFGQYADGTEERAVYDQLLPPS
jgi:hypothetical protein